MEEVRRETGGTHPTDKKSEQELDDPTAPGESAFCILSDVLLLLYATHTHTQVRVHSVLAYCILCSYYCTHTQVSE
jgi:hypothetical protein